MMPENARSATVTEEGAPNPWVNRHQNVSQVYEKIYSVVNAPPPNSFGDLQLAVQALQGLIAGAIADGKTIRAIGGGWSLSNAAVTDGVLVDTLGLNTYFPSVAASVVPAYTGDPAQLLYLQCGMTIKDANDVLFGLPTPLALKTSGASNGQTIAGARLPERTAPATNSDPRRISWWACTSSRDPPAPSGWNAPPIRCFRI